MPTEPRRLMKGKPVPSLLVPDAVMFVIDVMANPMVRVLHRGEKFSDLLNPLDFISNSREVPDDCRDLEEQLQKRKPDCNQAQVENDRV